MDSHCRGSGALAWRAPRTYGLTSRWRREGSVRRMYHGRHGRRRQFDSHGCRRSTRRYALDCADTQRSSAIRPDGFLPLLERRWWRRRHHPGNNRSRLYDRRRPRRGRSTAAQDRLFCGYHRRRNRSDGRAHNGVFIEMYRISCDRLRRRERLGRGRRDGAGYAAIDVVDVRYIDGLVVDDRGVVNIVDDRRIHSGVRDVDVIHIASTHRIGRNVNLTRSKCKPGDPRADANPGHQRRRVDRT
jgi:hypothetical protein